MGHYSLRPANLAILPHKKAWLLNLDCIVLADAGNVYDTLFLTARAALWDTRVPLTRVIEYNTHQRLGEDGMRESGLDTRQSSQAADFELTDYWSEGEVLDERDLWPVCITLNLVRLFVFLVKSDLKHEVPSDIVDALPRRDTTGRRSRSIAPTPFHIVPKIRGLNVTRHSINWIGRTWVFAT